MIEIENSNIELPITKICKTCNETKTIDDFQIKKSKTGKERHDGTCKKCRYVRLKERQELKKQGKLPSDGKLPKIKPGIHLSMWQQMINAVNLNEFFKCNETPKLYQETIIAMRKSVLGDRDSWKQREYHASVSAGWKHVEEKDGADAYTQDGRPIELKINWANELRDYGTSKPLDGHGSFNDYNQNRLNRLHEQNYKMALPFYVSAKLIAMATFDARHPEFFDKLQEQLNKKTSPNGKGRIAPAFTHKHWIDAPSLEWIILPTTHDLLNYQYLINKDILESLATTMTNKMETGGISNTKLSNSKYINF